MGITTISHKQACHRCSPDLFDFSTTADIEKTVPITGQDRALEAVEFGINIKKKGFNLFVIGPQGTGRHTVIRSYIDEKAHTAAPPKDWCYVENFNQPHRPKSLSFPIGEAQIFKKEMQDLVQMLRLTLSTVFESDDYKARVKAVKDEFKSKVDDLYREIEEGARQDSIAVVKSDQGIMVAPIDGEGNILESEAYLKLPEATRKRIDSLIEKYQNMLQEGMHQISLYKRESEAATQLLKKDLAARAVTSLTDILKHKYASQEEVADYLKDVETDAINHVDDFLYKEATHTDQVLQMMAPPPSFERYEVNILVGNYSKGAPVIYEDLPTYQNLHGRIENYARMGMLSTHFTLIKPGSLHRANGGYIIIDARRLLLQPHAYEGLKRTLRSGTINIESLERLLGLMNTVSLEPEPIKLDAKVVLIGDAQLYYLLKQYDPEFDSLFKVQVDFEHAMERSKENIKLYSSLVAGMVDSEHLAPVNREGMARLVEHSSRIAGDGKKLCLYLEQLADILKEADHLTRKEGLNHIGKEQLQAALDAGRRRSSRIRDRMVETMEEGIRHIATEGKEVGQINGLSVLSLPGSVFGMPSRITALTRAGKDQEVIDIERQVELGGPIHSKGVMILESFLRSRFLPSTPFGVRASLVFEQSYGGVDGDSASCAELCALLSSLSQVPLQQSIAITGSISQRGEIQAIGGVNEKIEGFFELCKSRELTGEQGVIIPQANVRHLMLAPEVVEAMSKDEFHIWSVTEVDDAIELLTGIPAGTRDENGSFPEGTINYLVEEKLTRFVTSMRDFDKQDQQEQSTDDN